MLAISRRPWGASRSRRSSAAASRLDTTSVRAAAIAFDEGGDSFGRGAYDAAARSFEQGYAALKVPQMLYDEGASLYMVGKRDGDAASYRRAADLYTRYLASDPIAPGVADAIEAIEGEVARLEGGGAREARSPAIQTLPDPEIRGFVVLTSDPSEATVYVDDPARGPIGTTPWSGTLDGDHKLYIAKPGHSRFEYPVTFDRHRFLVLNAELTAAPGANP